MANPTRKMIDPEFLSLLHFPDNKKQRGAAPLSKSLYGGADVTIHLLSLSTNSSTMIDKIAKSTAKKTSCAQQPKIFRRVIS